MEREIILTADGSHSLFVPALDEHYHSINGALQESLHIYIGAGLKSIEKKSVTILEVGFGTGLNAILSILEGNESNRDINYLSVEKYPLAPDEFSKLNFPAIIGEENHDLFLKIHQCEWDKPITISPAFVLHKIHDDLRNVNFSSLPFFDLVFFDAFAPNKQPDLWEKQLFSSIFDHSNPGAVLVTYCAKGSVRRDLQDVGYHVERIAGPPGKKQILRAIK